MEKKKVTNAKGEKRKLITKVDEKRNKTKSRQIKRNRNKNKNETGSHIKQPLGTY